jgi:hypothetical protein
MFNEINTPYKVDLPLLMQLGLREFICETNVSTSLGTVENEEYAIDVHVTCAPAQFWRFDILCKEDGKRTVLETGSGTFTQYWNVAELIGRNLVSVMYMD